MVSKCCAAQRSCSCNLRSPRLQRVDPSLVGRPQRELWRYAGILQGRAASSVLHGRHCTRSSSENAGARRKVSTAVGAGQGVAQRNTLKASEQGFGMAGGSNLPEKGRVIPSGCAQESCSHFARRVPRCPASTSLPSSRCVACRWKRSANSGARRCTDHSDYRKRSATFGRRARVAQ